MNNERILAHKMAKQLSAEELENVSAAGTTTLTGNVTFSSGVSDGHGDVAVDI